MISSLKTVVQLTQLEVLYIYGNTFPSLPLTICPLIQNLKEFALEWFKYTQPPLPPILSRKQHGFLFKKMIDFINERSSYAKKSDEIWLVEFLILFSDENFDVFGKDEKNRTIMHHAAIEDEIGMISALANLKNDVITRIKENSIKINLQKNFKGSSKYKKMSKDDYKPQKSLNKGSNKFFEDQKASYSIDKLAEERTFDNKNNYNQNKFIDEVDIDNHTALSLAILEGKFRSAEILLNYNADVNKGGGIFGSVLHLAAIKMRKDLIQRILRYA